MKIWYLVFLGSVADWLIWYLVSGILYFIFGARFIYFVFWRQWNFCINYQFAPKARFFWGILLLTKRKIGISIFNLGFGILIFEPDWFIWYLVFENRRIDLFGIWYWDFQIIIYSTKIPNFHARTVIDEKMYSISSSSSSSSLFILSPSPIA